MALKRVPRKLLHADVNGRCKIENVTNFCSQCKFHGFIYILWQQVMLNSWDHNALSQVWPSVQYTGLQLSHLEIADNYDDAMDLLHKSRFTSIPYPTMHHFVTDVCTFLLQNGPFVQCIKGFVRWDYFDVISRYTRCRKLDHNWYKNVNHQWSFASTVNLFLVGPHKLCLYKRRVQRKTLYSFRSRKLQKWCFFNHQYR